MTHRMLSFLLLTVAAFTAFAADSLVSYVPHFHGVVRARYEYDFAASCGRFQVRNARVSMAGNVAPGIDYFVQADLCDRGKMKILDAYGRFRIISGLTFQAGQFKMPFGIETLRAPHNYIFANRSFMDKQVMNYRAVGAKAAYQLSKLPLTLQVGVFNPTTIGDHSGWHRTYAYSGMISWKPGKWTFSASAASIKPETIRASLLDGAAEWRPTSAWLLAAEYMFKRYSHNIAADAHSWLAFASWSRNVKLGVFNRWSLQGRYDGMTRHRQLTGTESFDPACQRITLGSTLTYGYRELHADVRLNFEHYFYSHTADSDRIVAEMVVRF